MNFSDVKLLLPASGFMKTSEVDGRTVIDEIRDGSYERNHQTFVGDDRPELSALDGFKVSVEKESTNVVLYSRDMTTVNWVLEQSLSGTRNKDATGIYGDVNSATTLTDNDSEDFYSVQQNIPVASNSATHIVSIYVRKDNNEERFTELFVTFRGGDPIINYIYQVNTKTGATVRRSGDVVPVISESTGDFWRVVIPVTNNGSGNNELRIVLRPAMSSVFGSYTPTTGSAVFGHVQVELNTAYPTLPIITQGTAVTRLAPNSQIVDGLVDSGTVAFQGEVVRDDSVNQDLFITTGDAGTELSRLRLNTSNEFELQIFGATGGSITQVNPFTGWGNNERLDLQIGVNYDAANLYLFLSDGANTFFYTVSHSINSTANKAFTYGNNHSMRLKTFSFKDEISRTTQAEFETLFEVI